MRGGAPPGLNIRRGGHRRQPEKKRNIRTLVLVIAIAFLFLFTPAQDRIRAQIHEWMDQLLDEYGPARIYPVHASYSVERRVILVNPHGTEINFNYRLPIPFDRSDFGRADFGFEMTDGSVLPTDLLQSISRMEVRSAVGNTPVQIPFDSNDILLETNAIDLDSASAVYWPPLGENQNRCNTGRCVIWSGSIPPGTTATLIVEYDVSGSSFSWWDSSRAPDEAPRSSTGFSMTVGNAGSFADLSRPGHMGDMKAQFGSHSRWYDREPSPNDNYAIDGLDSIVVELAAEIHASLDAADADNAFAFAHAAFIEVRDTLTYSEGLSPARSGPVCLSEGRGDCDEQANAWMSILRTRQIPTWYEFGPMTDAEYAAWEPHAWANIILPFDEDWCNARDIKIESCWIEGEVDVVNNKWLLHTPTTFTEWIETPSNLGEDAFQFYRPLVIGCNGCWTETWNTLGQPEITGGTFRVPVREGV